MTEVDSGVLMSALNNRGIDPSIVAMLNDKCKDGSLGGDWIILLFLFLLGMGGNGFGFGNKGDAQVDRAVASEANYSRLMEAVSSTGMRQEMAVANLAQSLGCSNQAVQSALAGLDKQLALTGGDVRSAIQSCCCNIGSKVDTTSAATQNMMAMQSQALQSQISQCCCATNNNLTQGFANVNLNGERNTNAIIQAINAQTVAMSNGFCELEKRELKSYADSLRDKVFEQSQSAQTAQIIAALKTTSTTTARAETADATPLEDIALPDVRPS